MCWFVVILLMTENHTRKVKHGLVLTGKAQVNRKKGLLPKSHRFDPKTSRMNLCRRSKKVFSWSHLINSTEVPLSKAPNRNCGFSGKQVRLWLCLELCDCGQQKRAAASVSRNKRGWNRMRLKHRSSSLLLDKKRLDVSQLYEWLLQSMYYSLKSTVSV